MVKLDLVHGDGDVVALLEEMLSKAKEGAYDAVVVVLCTKDGQQGWDRAYKEDMVFPFARMMSGLSCLQYEFAKHHSGDESQ